jgi:hypothetical protein
MRSGRIVVKSTFEFILPLLGTYHLIYITLDLRIMITSLVSSNFSYKKTLHLHHENTEH